SPCICWQVRAQTSVRAVALITLDSLSYRPLSAADRRNGPTPHGAEPVSPQIKSKRFLPDPQPTPPRGRPAVDGPGHLGRGALAAPSHAQLPEVVGGGAQPAGQLGPAVHVGVEGREVHAPQSTFRVDANATLRVDHGGSASAYPVGMRPVTEIR